VLSSLSELLIGHATSLKRHHLRGVGHLACDDVLQDLLPCLQHLELLRDVLALRISQANDAAREALIADVRNALGKYTSNSELAFPIAAHLLDARV